MLPFIFLSVLAFRRKHFRAAAAILPENAACCVKGEKVVECCTARLIFFFYFVFGSSLFLKYILKIKDMLRVQLWLLVRVRLSSRGMTVNHVMMFPANRFVCHCLHSLLCWGDLFHIFVLKIVFHYNVKCWYYWMLALNFFSSDHGRYTKAHLYMFLSGSVSYTYQHFPWLRLVQQGLVVQVVQVHL